MLKRLNKLKQRDKIIVVNILFFILFFCVYYFLIQSGLNELSVLNNDIGSKKTALEILEKKGNDVKRFKQSLTLADSIVGKISEYFIANEVEFVTMIENTASDLGLTERLVMGDARVTGKVKVVPITLYTQGTFKEQLAFINKLSELKYFFNIRAIDFAKVSAAKVGNESDDVKLNMVLNIDTYWQIDEK
jgi:Tfp pilus assembly protein PilO